MHDDRTGRAAIAGVVLAVALARPAAAGDLASLRDRGVLRVATSGDYAPFSVAKDDGFSGFDVEMMDRLARDLGVRIQYVRFRWPDLAKELAGKKFDLVASGVTVRPERALLGRYTRPYAITGAMALIRREDRTRLVDRLALDREGVRIVVNRGGHLEQVARRQFRHATIETLPDNSKLVERVLVGTADAALTDSAEARAWERKELTTVGPFTRDRKALLVRRDAPELAQWIDGWLRERERDHWLADLRQKWFGDSMFYAAAADREAVLADVDLRCQMMPMVAATKVAQELPILDQAQEERVLERCKQTAREVGLNPAEVARLFAALIHAAKVIEIASGTDPNAFAPPLQQLRTAIGDVDTHLIRQLHEAVRTVKPNEWRAGVREGVQADGLADAVKAEIADALVKVRTLVRVSATPVIVAPTRPEPPAPQGGTP
jgi:cyclohexadienyl dehydratase